MSQDDPDASIARPAERVRWLETRSGLLTLVAITALVLASIGLWTYRMVETSLRELRSDSMQGLLDAQVNGLRVWIGEALSDAERIARDPAVRNAALALIERAEREKNGSGDLAGVCASPERARLDEVLRPLLTDEGSAGHNVISLQGRLLSTRFPTYCGLAIHPQRFQPLIEDVFRGKSKFVRPVRDADRVESPPSVREGGPLAWMVTPVRDASGRVRAALGIADPAEARFTSILAATRPGRTGEVYAFDSQGFMLSESRFLADLQRMRLLPTGATALLEAQVREAPVPNYLQEVREQEVESDLPGEEFRQRPPAERPPPRAEDPPPAKRGKNPGQTLTGSDPGAERPLTRLAAAALASRGAANAQTQRGVLLEPYRSYHGPAVVGVWRWLPEIDVVVAFEIEADEAYAPLHFLQLAFAATVGALVVAAVAALGTGLLAAQLRLRFGRGEKAGAYVIQREIGAGGMANVYLAQHALLKRPTAVKILKRTRATDEMVARFEREVRLASQLSHPNTVEIFDYGRMRDGRLYYAMEYLDGITLAQMVAQSGPAPVARAVHILRQLCAGLAEAHTKGLVHRDIKPENIMVCRRGIELDVVKILDFGLVKNVADPHTRDLTRGLRILGTPLYMAPERIRSPADVDARADIYSVGVVGFFLLTGKKLFESEDDLELAQRVLNDPPPRASSIATGVPPALDELILACLAKRREERPADGAALLEALEALEGEYRWTQAQAAQARARQT